MSSIHIIIPCFNEADRLRQEAFRAFVSEQPDVRLLFVDDGSTDGTATVLARLCAEAPGQMRSLELEQNQGKAEAVRRGLLQALASGASYVGFWDADLATPLDAVDDFMKIFRERPKVEMVFGSRVKLMGWDIDRSRARHYSGRVFATVVSTLLRIPIYDTQCGAKIFRVTEATRHVFGEAFLSRWVFDVEVLARDLQMRWADPGLVSIDEALYEMPLRAWNDVEGSKVKAMDFFWAMRDVFRIYRRYLRKSIWSKREKVVVLPAMPPPEGRGETVDARKEGPQEDSPAGPLREVEPPA